MNLTHAFTLAAAFAASLSLASCGTTGTVGADMTTPVPGVGEVSVKFEVNIGGSKTATVEATKPICLKYTYRNSEGAVVGSSVVEVPGSHQIPAGAVSWSAEVVKCPAASGSAGAGGMYDLSATVLVQGVQRQAIAGADMPWTFFGGNIIPNAQGATNVSYSFSIQAPSRGDAMARRDYVLAGGIGTQTGPGFEVCYYNESEAELDNLGLPVGVRMRQAEVGDDFLTYTLTVNGAIVADLSSATNLLHYSANNGWNVVESFVPLTSFDTGTNYDNTAEASWTTLNTSRSWRATQNVTGSN